MTPDPHTAERMILIGCHNAAARPSTMRILLHPEQRRQWYGQCLAFLNDTIKYDSTSCAVFVQPDYRDWTETEGIIQLVEAHYAQARINQNTVEAIGARQGVNFIRNLRRIAAADGRMRDIRHSIPSMTGQTAVVCGAGVSFEDDAGRLREHVGPIIAVNTSAGACAWSDVHPHLVVCTESKPVTEGVKLMDHSCSQFAMDLTGHADNWPEDKEAGPLLGFMGTEPNLIPYAQRLGMLPLAYGSSCTTAAVSLALACGAERVVLVGQDCSFSTVGPTQVSFPDFQTVVLGARMYAAGTPYEDTEVFIDVGTKRAIVDKPTVGRMETDAVQVPGIGGGSVWTTHSMLSFAHWFRDQPAEVRGKIVNCTSAGALIDGLEHAALRDAMQVTGARYGAGFNRQHCGQLESLGFAERAARVLRHLVKVGEHGRVMRGDADIMIWARKHLILNMWVAPERLRMRRLDDLSAAERGHRVAETIRQACRDIVEYCGERD